MLERPKGQHYYYANHVRDCTRIEQGRPGTARRLVARQLFLVDEFTREDQDRQGQRQRLSSPSPRVVTTEKDVRRKISAEEQNQRRKDELDYIGKKGRPARTGFR